MILAVSAVRCRSVLRRFVQYCPVILQPTRFGTVSILMENTILLQWGSFAQESNIYCTIIAPVRIRTTYTAWYVSGNVISSREKRSGQTRHRDITVTLNVRLCRGWRVRTIQTCYFFEFFFCPLLSGPSRDRAAVRYALLQYYDTARRPCNPVPRTVYSSAGGTVSINENIHGVTVHFAVHEPLAHTREWTSAVST